MKLSKLLVLFALCLELSPASSTGLPSSSLEELTAKYGKPDKVKSTAHDKPRPPFVTQVIEYRKERVRFVLTPNAPMGSPPPYHSWLLLGVADTATNQPIYAAETEQRMMARRKK